MQELVHHLTQLLAVDCKLTGVIRDENDRIYLQDYLDKLVILADEWRMRFNYCKCKIMDISDRVKNLPLSMTDTSRQIKFYLEESVSERDLGIKIQSNLKWKRLAMLGLTTIVDRRKRGDVIQIISEQNIINWHKDIQVYECLCENGPTNNLRHTRR